MACADDEFPQETQVQQQRRKEFRSSARYIYGSRLASQFTNRLLQFVIPMMFITMWTDTFLPTALLSFTTYATHFFVLPYCGALMDSAHRRRAATLLISVKSLCNAGALLALFAAYHLEMDSQTQPQFTSGHKGFALCCVLSIIGETAEESWTLSLERNWVVLMSQNDETLMTELNIAIRRIDLGCLTIAPLSFGIVLQLCNGADLQITVGTMVTGVLFLIAWIPEMTFAQRAYDGCQLLQHTDGDGSHSSATQLIASKKNVVSVLVGSWSRYTRHHVFWASFSYSMIYFTVLDGGSFMLAYLKWAGVSDTVIGLSRGVGAAMGLLGSALFVPVKDILGGGLERTGTVSIWIFWLMISPAAVVALLASSPMTLGYTLVVCVALSRSALWLFDLDHTLIMQAYLDDGERAELNGAQSALYRVFWLLLSIVCLVLSDPRDYWKLAVLSIGVVGTSALIFTAWAAASNGPRLVIAAADRSDDPRMIGEEEPRSPECDHDLAAAKKLW
jgi:solute carrier family 40 (iron-regulated transporter), member 1